jgi:hypothetical protein
MNNTTTQVSVQHMAEVDWLMRACDSKCGAETCIVHVTHFICYEDSNNNRGTFIQTKLGQL